MTIPNPAQPQPDPDGTDPIRDILNHMADALGVPRPARSSKPEPPVPAMDKENLDKRTIDAISQLQVLPPFPMYAIEEVEPYPASLVALINLRSGEPWYFLGPVPSDMEVDENAPLECPCCAHMIKEPKTHLLHWPTLFGYSIQRVWTFECEACLRIFWTSTFTSYTEVGRPICHIYRWKPYARLKLHKVV